MLCFLSVGSKVESFKLGLYLKMPPNYCITTFRLLLSPLEVQVYLLSSYPTLLGEASWKPRLFNRNISYYLWKQDKTKDIIIQVNIALNF